MFRVRVSTKGVGDAWGYRRFGLSRCENFKEVILPEYSLEEIKEIENAQLIANGVYLLYDNSGRNILGISDVRNKKFLKVNSIGTRIVGETILLKSVQNAYRRMDAIEEHNIIYNSLYNFKTGDYIVIEAYDSTRTYFPEDISVYAYDNDYKYINGVLFFSHSHTIYNTLTGELYKEYLFDFNSLEDKDFIELYKIGENGIETSYYNINERIITDTNIQENEYPSLVKKRI